MLTHCGTRPMETGRVLLRRFTLADAEAVFKIWAGDAQVQTMLAEPVYETPQQVRGLLERYIAAYGREDVYRWAVIEKQSGLCIGQIAFFLVDSKNHFAEIEYCIGRAFQNRGYATEATKAVIAYGFHEIGLHKIQICTMTNNAPSKRVIEKCGFTYEGTLRDYFYTADGYVGRHYFSMLESEYRNR